MNFIDVLLIFLALSIFARHQHFSFVYYTVCGFFGFLGFLIAVLIAPVMGRLDFSDLTKGIIFLALMLLFVAVFYVGSSVGVARRLRARLLYSKYYRLDQIMAVPAKIIILLMVIILASKTLIYVPVLSLQFMAQGSTIIYALDKKIPDNPITKLTSKLAPNQFKDMTLEYSPQKSQLKASSIQRSLSE